MSNKSLLKLDSLQMHMRCIMQLLLCVPAIVANFINIQCYSQNENIQKNCIESQKILTKCALLKKLFTLMYPLNNDFAIFLNI